MFDATMIELSRWQFAATAMYHCIFVPLTLGMVWILVITVEALLSPTATRIPDRSACLERDEPSHIR